MRLCMLVCACSHARCWPVMLLSTLQCTGQPPTIKVAQFVQCTDAEGSLSFSSDIRNFLGNCYERYCLVYSCQTTKIRLIFIWLESFFFFFNISVLTAKYDPLAWGNRHKGIN